jgi:hypothetical protein
MVSDHLAGSARARLAHPHELLLKMQLGLETGRLI